MAGVTAGAAYKELDKVGNYVAPQINAGADRLARQGMQQKQLNADAKAKQEKRDDEWLDNSRVDMSNFEVEATGNADIDDMYRNGANQAISVAQDFFRQSRELYATDRKQAEVLRDKGRAVENSFKNLAKETSVIKPMLDGYIEDYKAGKIKDESYRGFINGLVRNEAKLYIDDNNNWRARVLLRDETSGEIKRDDNGEPMYIDKSLADVRKGIDKPYYFNELHGKDGELNKVLTAMGDNKWDEIEGQFTVSNKEFGKEQEKSLNDFIKGTLGNDREMYKWYNYATGKEKFKDFTVKDKEVITNFITNAVKGAYGKETSMKVTPQTQAQREAENARNRAGKGGGGGGNKNTPTVTAVPITNDGVTHIKNGFTFKTKNNTPIKGIMEGNDDAEVTAVRLVGGKISAMVRSTPSQGGLDEALDGKPSQSSEWVDLTDEESSRLATYVGGYTTKDLKDYLDEQAKGLKSGTPSGTSNTTNKAPSGGNVR